jgi:hypothetical protein
MLKGIGAGAAVAWSAPILTSISTPAFAQASGGPCAGKPDCLQGCNGHLLCGNPCFCMQRHSDKACVCIGQGLCADCNSDADCDPVTGPGSTCVDVDQNAGCCVGFSNTACQPPCGSQRDIRHRAARKGLKLSPAV